MSGTTPPKGWYCRGYLPHRDTPGLIQSITYRLADSLPREAIERLEQELRSLPESERPLHKARRLEGLLDAGHGSNALSHPDVARIVVENWRHHDPVRYRLVAWIVMPNHVHVMVHVLDETSLPGMLKAWKGYTSRMVRRLGLPVVDRMVAAQRGAFWARDFHDRYIRDQRHFGNVVRYIHENPVKAGLVSSAEQWAWSSAREFDEEEWVFEE